MRNPNHKQSSKFSWIIKNKITFIGFTFEAPTVEFSFACVLLLDHTKIFIKQN